MQILLIIMQLFPLLLQAIQTIETTAATPKVGAAKLQLLTEVIHTASGSGQFDAKMISQVQLLSIIQTIAAAIVAFYNLIGAFKTTSPVSEPTPISS